MPLAPQTQEDPLALAQVQGITTSMATLVAQVCVTKGFHLAETPDLRFVADGHHF